jgi:RNA polymerase primary sigma factor
VHLGERRRQLLTASSRLAGELGREPTREELADATGLPLLRVVEAMDVAEVSSSLNQTLGDAEVELSELMPDDAARDPLELTEEALERRDLLLALAALPARQRRIIRLHFGFEGAPWTLEEIAADLGLTRERVRQVELQAFGVLARALRSYAA